ncbi:hypothetical protein PIIN_06067 [Serendipita indica DSM 11827]|uniref:CBM1 domain-containing protein n=1 Tax=Serendipita indica (strain DSM 11827) TaxID=1109443 RepID=G4TLD8_SERID|nr:hypothetical protein PIIN_06067 [Serendipita indica DSM 11827]
MRLFTTSLYALALAGTAAACTTTSTTPTIVTDPYPPRSTTTSSTKSIILTDPCGYPNPTTCLSSTTSTRSGYSKLWQQCGGIGWTGPIACSEGVCTYLNGISSNSSHPLSSRYYSLVQSVSSGNHLQLKTFVAITLKFNVKKIHNPNESMQIHDLEIKCKLRDRYIDLLKPL